jgi:ATP-binding cassette subfamily B protein
VRHVPVVLQTGAADCGAACLTMVLRAAGHPATLRELRDLLGDSRDGVSADAMVRAGREYHLVAKGMVLEPSQLAGLPPTILHWEFNHFVVLERWTPRESLVIDPAVGRRRLGAEEFGRGYTAWRCCSVPGRGSVRRHPARHRRGGGVSSGRSWSRTDGCGARSSPRPCCSRCSG